MLRRKPTALTVSPEDIQAYDLQQAKWTQTRQEARSLAATAGSVADEAHDRHMQEVLRYRQMERARELQADAQVQAQGQAQGQQAVDPSDELKPLPGDKARIVRSREERIRGVGSGSSAGPPGQTGSRM